MLHIKPYWCIVSLYRQTCRFYLHEGDHFIHLGDFLDSKTRKGETTTSKCQIKGKLLYFWKCVQGEPPVISYSKSARDIAKHNMQTRVCVCVQAMYET